MLIMLVTAFFSPIANFDQVIWESNLVKLVSYAGLLSPHNSAIKGLQILKFRQFPSQLMSGGVAKRRPAVSGGVGRPAQHLVMGRVGHNRGEQTFTQHWSRVQETATFKQTLINIEQ